MACCVELNCETDFVAKNESFQKAAAEILATAVRTGAVDRLALLNAEVKPGITVQQRIDEASVAIKEKVELGRFARLEGGYIERYLHKSDPSLPPSVGVLVQLEAENAELAKDLAQQVAAMRPSYVTPGRAHGGDGEGAQDRRADHPGRGQAREGRSRRLSRVG